MRAKFASSSRGSVLRLALQATDKENRMDSLMGRWRCEVGSLAVTVGLLAAAGASAGWAATLPGSEAPAAQTFGVTMPSGTQKAEKSVRLMPSERAGMALVGVPEVRLEAVDRDALLKEDALNERDHRTKNLRFGVARDVQVAAGDGDWYDIGGGAKLWVADVVSTEALGIRLPFKDVHLPSGAVLAVYGPQDRSAAGGTFKNGFPAFDPERHAELYQGSEAQSRRTDFWTGTLTGERVRVEYLAPAGAASSELPFAVDSLQHLYLDPVAKLAKILTKKAAAGPCHNDVSCFP